MSQERLAEAAGVHRTYVSLLERGRKAPTIVTLFQLAQALGSSPSDLVRDMERELGIDAEETL